MRNIVRSPIDFGFNASGSVPTGLLGNSDLAFTTALALTLRLSVRPAQVARDEEPDKEVGQGRKIEDIEPDSKGLAGCDNGRDNVGFVDGFLDGRELGCCISV